MSDQDVFSTTGPSDVLGEVSLQFFDTNVHIVTIWYLVTAVSNIGNANEPFRLLR